MVEARLVVPLPPSTGVELETAVDDEITMLSDLVVTSELLEVLGTSEMLEEVEIIFEEVSGPCDPPEILKPEVSITGYEVTTVDERSEDKSKGVDKEG